MTVIAESQTGEAGRPHTRFVSSPLSLFLLLFQIAPPRVFVCFVSKEFTEQEGRASSGGRWAGHCRWGVGRR